MATDLKHTPGPWAVSKKASRRVTADGVVICNAVLRNRGGPKHRTYMKDEHEAEANASLIAAAPELLEALRNLLLAVGGGSKEEWSEVISARAAIAKAGA